MSGKRVMHPHSPFSRPKGRRKKMNPAHPATPKRAPAAPQYGASLLKRLRADPNFVPPKLPPRTPVQKIPLPPDEDPVKAYQRLRAEGVHYKYLEHPTLFTPAWATSHKAEKKQEEEKKKEEKKKDGEKEEKKEEKKEEEGNENAIPDINQFIMPGKEEKKKEKEEEKEEKEEIKAIKEIKKVLNFSRNGNQGLEEEEKVENTTAAEEEDEAADIVEDAEEGEEETNDESNEQPASEEKAEEEERGEEKKEEDKEEDKKREEPESGFCLAILDLAKDTNFAPPPRRRSSLNAAGRVVREAAKDLKKTNLRTKLSNVIRTIHGVAHTTLRKILWEECQNIQLVHNADATGRPIPQSSFVHEIPALLALLTAFFFLRNVNGNVKVAVVKPADMIKWSNSIKTPFTRGTGIPFYGEVHRIYKGYFDKDERLKRAKMMLRFLGTLKLPVEFQDD